MKEQDDNSRERLSHPPRSANFTLPVVLISISFTHTHTLLSVPISGGKRAYYGPPTRKSSVNTLTPLARAYIRRRMEYRGRWIITPRVQKEFCHCPWSLTRVFRLHFIRHGSRTQCYRASSPLLLSFSEVGGHSYGNASIPPLFLR